jgi:hypothetical protein
MPVAAGPLIISRRGEVIVLRPVFAFDTFSTSSGRTMPRDGAIIFGDLIGKLEFLHVACDKCGRKGRYPLASLVRYRMVAFRQ